MVNSSFSWVAEGGWSTYACAATSEAVSSPYGDGSEHSEAK
ncbi:hypothetical protein [Campylobacter showae]|uniref:Uncharacterized protein n=1 Tax=Campylobacter showae CSUNSWCD TaxID=1244083 RepID=M5IPU3_9BACT|nr:hypothetical protein [Campylobacter showae]EKU11139.1 hypothetical protein CSUNSWCD_2262 [Campylobacter showae CSUNSWCD]